jgi:cobalt/nickel transport system permease protein
MTLALDLPPPAESFLSRVDPRWRLAAFILAAAATATFRTLPAAAVAALAAFLLVLLSRLPLSWFLSRLVQILPFLILFTIWLPFTVDAHGSRWQVGPLHLSAAGVHAAATLILKAVTLLTLMIVLLATAPLPTTLQAAHALRLPSLLIHLLLLTYRYVFLLAQEFTRLRIALRVRGYRSQFRLHTYRTIGHVAGTLLVRSHDRAERVGQAMRCRGFDGSFRSLATFHTTIGDIAFFMMMGTNAGLLWAWDWMDSLANWSP